MCLALAAASPFSMNVISIEELSQMITDQSVRYNIILIRGSYNWV